MDVASEALPDAALGHNTSNNNSNMLFNSSLGM
jgi:hypothetical protein